VWLRVWLWWMLSSYALYRCFTHVIAVAAGAGAGAGHTSFTSTTGFNRSMSPLGHSMANTTPYSR
jgi:hypothetical protein